MPTSMEDFALYLNIAFFGALGLGMIFGFLRGFKKSIFSFITTLIFYVVFFFTIDLAVNFLWTVQIAPLGSWVSGFMPSLSSITSLSQAIPILLENFLGEMLGDSVSNPQLLFLVNGLALFAVKIVWTVLYFTIILLVYKLICAIIFSLFFHSRKLDKKYGSQNRGFGAVFGLLEGALTVFVSLIMMGGLISVCESLVGFIPPEVEPEPSEVILEMPRQSFYELSYSIIPEVQETAMEIPDEINVYIEMMNGIVNAYNANIVVTTANMATMTDQNQTEVPLSIYLFDEVLSFDYQPNASDPESETIQVSIRKELSVFAQIGAVIISKDFSTGNVADMGITRDDIITIFTKLSESNLITSILPLAIEISADYLDTEIDLPVEDLYQIPWKEELADLGVIVATVYEIADSVGFFDEGGVDYETVELDGELIDEFFTSLSGSELVSLAAFVAVEPLLAMAGEQVQAIITVPANMDWSAEFLAIGSIVSEVLAADPSIPDIMSGDYTVIIQAVANVDFVVLLESKLITNAMINVLSGNSGIEQLSFLEVPEGTIWLDQYDNDGNLVAAGELRNILSALNSVINIASGVGDLTNVMEDPASLLSTVGEMTDEDIDSIFGSGILVATLSTMISDLELGDFALVIPDDVYDENGYIIKAEFVAVAHSARIIATEMACDLEDAECDATGFDLSKALSLSEESVDELVASEIIAASVGKLVYDMAGDPLVVPLSATETLVVDQANVVVVSDQEIKNVFMAVSAIGITDIDNITFDASLLNNLEEPTDPLLLTETDASDEDHLVEEKMVNLFSSEILVATISDVLIDLTTGEDSLIVIPYKDVEGLDIRTIDNEGVETISTVELRHVLDALLAIDITDFENMDSINLNLIIDNSSILLKSAILHATVSKQLFDLGTDTVTIPYFNEEGDAIRITQGTGAQATTYLAKSELEAAFDALEVLNITDINSFDGTFDMELLTEEGNVTTLLGSAVIHATVSTMLFDMTEADPGAEAVLAVPYFDQEENPIRITVGDPLDDTDTTYLKKTEIEAIVDALDVFGITDIESFDGTFDMTALTAEGNIEILLQSAVIHATVSKTLFDMTEGVDATLEIPYFNDENASIRVDVGVVAEGTHTEYLLDTEIEAIIDGLDVFGITDIESFDGSFDMTALTTEGNIEILLRSAVIHATVSKTLFDMAEGVDATLEIPYYNDLNQSIRVNVGSIAEQTDTEYLLDTEIEAIIDGLDVFGITDIESFTGSFDMSALTTEGNIEILLHSAVIHATVSKTLFDMSEGEEATLTIPYFDQDENPIRITVGDALLETDTVYLLDTEIEAIVDALNVFGITDIDSFTGSFDMSKITEGDNITTLLLSATIHATISDTLFDMAEGEDATLTVPYLDEDGVSVRKTVGEAETESEYLVKTEIEAIIDALNVFGITDIDSFTGSFDMSKITEGDNITTLLLSATIHATISDTLFEMAEGEDATLTVPYFDELGVSIRVNVGVGEQVTNYLKKQEIEAIVDALNVFGITDIDSFTGSFDMSKITEGDNITTLLLSATIHATISDTLFEMAEGEDATLTIPHFDELGVSIRTNVGAGEQVTNYLNKTEIEAIVDALNVFGITDIDSFTGSFDMSKITEGDNITTLLLSATIHATISDTLFEMAEGEDATLTVPYFDELGVSIRVNVGVGEQVTNYLKKQEIEAIVDALNVFGITDIDSFTGSFDMSAITQEGNIEKLLLSATIQATISQTLFDMTVDDPATIGVDEATLNIPYYDVANQLIRATVGVELEGTQTVYLLKTEIEAIVDALNVFGIDDINNFSGAFNMAKITEGDNITTLLLSATIHATISDTLFEMAEGEDATLTVPYFDELGVSIRTSVGMGDEATNYLNKLEIEAIVDGLNVFGITDINSFDGEFDMSAITAEGNIEILLTSSTIQATISKTLFDMTVDDPATVDVDEATLNIPYYDVANQLIRATVGVELEGTRTVYLVKDEIEAIVDALNVFGITDISKFSGAFNMAKITEGNNITTLLLSATIHATISDTLFEMSEGEDATLTIPYFDELGVSIRTNVGAGLEVTNYLNKLEIEAIVDALNVFGITDIDSFSGTFDMSAITAEGNIEILLMSSTIQATISKTLFDMTIDDPATVDVDEATLNIPYYNSADELIRAIVGVELEGTRTVYLVKDEIEAIVDALNVFGIIDISKFDGAFNMAKITEGNNITTLLLSATIHATISDTLFEMSDGVDATLTIPYFDELGVSIRTTVGAGLEVTNYLNKLEIEAIIDGLNVFGIADINNFDGDFDMSVLTVEGNIEILLTSSTIQATISKTLFDMTVDDPATGDVDEATLNIPYYNELNQLIRATVGVELEGTLTVYLKKDEITALVDALNIFGITNINNFNGNFDMTRLTAEGNIEILLASATIQATISDTLFAMTSLSVPYYNASDVAIRIEVGAGIEVTNYLVKSEIIAIVDALDVLDMTDLDSFGGTFDMSKLTAEGNIEILLASATIHATISSTILDMGTGVNPTLNVPYFDQLNVSIRAVVGEDAEETVYLLSDEIIAIVDALEVLEVTTLDNFAGSFNMALLTAPGNITVLLASTIIHATISDTLIDMASLNIPHFDQNESAIIIEVGNVVLTTDTTYILSTEIENLVTGLDVFGVTDLDDFGGTFDLASLTEGDNLDLMLQSAIIHASISKTLLEIATLTIPYFDEDEASIIISVGNAVLLTDTDYVAKSELTVLVDALDILGIADINSFSGTVSFTNLFVNNNLATVLLSSIIQATISQQMFDLEVADTINIPSTSMTGVAIIINVGDTGEGTDSVYVKRTEIQYFFEAIHMLAPANDDVTDFSGSFSLTILNNETNQDKLLLSATMHATISETLDELDDEVLLIPFTNQLDVTIKQTVSELYIVPAEIKALINAFLEMGFVDLDNFGSSLSSSEFFENTALLMLSASIQATISDKMLYGTGGVLIIPDTERFVHIDLTLIDKDEIIAIMAVLDTMGLTDFSSMAFNPTNIFAMDYNVLLASASMRATVSKTLLDVAANETAADGFSGLIVPLAKREVIQVGGSDFTQIESVELRKLLDSLKMLGIGNFSADFNPLVIMGMTEEELNTLLDSGSIHITIDKMLKGNDNVGSTIMIPTQALHTMYEATLHPIAGTITKAELVYFIRAVQELGGTDFTTFTINAAAILGLSADKQAIVMLSMIVRNSVNEALEVAINIENASRPYPGPYFTINAEDYMENNTALFFTYEDAVEALKFLKDQPFSDD